MANKLMASSLKLLEKLNPNMVADAETYSLPKIKLGSPRLNYLIGGDGLTIGRIHRLIGPESSGKSTLSTYIATQVQQRQDHNIVVYMDYERSFVPEYAAQMGLNIKNAMTDPEGKFIWLKPDSIEDGSVVLEELLKTDSIGLVIFDSEASASPRVILEGEFNKADFGSQAKALKNFCNRFTPLLDNYGATMIIISQERAQMAMSHAIQYTGGYALRFAASTLSRVRKVENITDKSGATIGIHMHVKNMKNKTTIPFREIDMELYFKEHDGKPAGFDADSEYIDFIKDLTGQNPKLDELFTYGGGYYKSPKYGVSLHGRNELVKWVAEHPTEFEEIKVVVNDTIAGNLTTDKTEEQAAAEDEEIANEMNATLAANALDAD